MNTDLNYLKSRIELDEMDAFQLALQNTDMVGAVEEIINDNNQTDLYNALYILQFIYNMTDLDEPISNELYDKLYERYKEVTGEEFVGAKAPKIYTGNKKMIPHTYPELRGSLDKVHFALDEDIPKKDTRKSLLSWVSKCQEELGRKLITLIPNYKYDGLSVVLEFVDGELSKAITRGITDDNLGLDITNLFIGLSLESIFEGSEEICDVIRECGTCGVKNEIIMTHDRFVLYNDDPDNVRKNNARSATSSIVNSKDINPEMFKRYLCVKPLQISTKAKIGKLDWIDVIGKIDDRYQYLIRTPEFDRFAISVADPSDPTTHKYVKDLLHDVVDNIVVKAEDNGIPIDGVVFTIEDDVDLMQSLGRKDNINKFQIAYKIPAGKRKTTLKDVVFQVGSLGTITPVAIVEPVVIMGNTITRPGLSNREKMERLDLNIGDEIIVTYDIVPTISKDDTCKKGNGAKIVFPQNCVSCGEPLTEYGKHYRCDNDDCPSRLSGKIINYLIKLGIKGIGPAIIKTLIDKGFVKRIGDLYRLHNYRDDIVALRGFGPIQYNNMVDAIYKKTTLYPHELLGALGIPDIGRSVMQKVCSNIPLNDLLGGEIDDILHRLVLIRGIADATARKIVNGLKHNQSTIDDVMKYIIIKDYTEELKPDLIVCFTKIRDNDFKEYLESKNIKVIDSYRKEVDVLITANDVLTSSKIEKARKDNKRILTLSEAYKEFGYEN